MSVHSLIDLFVPTPDAHDASVSVAMAGLDSGVLAFTDLEALEAFEATGPTPMHAGLRVDLEDTSALVLLPSCESEAYAPLLEAGTVDALQDTVRSLGGCAIWVGGPLGPAKIPVGATETQSARAGRLVHRVWASLLARDLSFEDAALTGRRLLGGTGPEGGLESVGQYATLLPIAPGDRAALIMALNDGLGIGVERVVAEEEASEKEPKKRRRRRRRRRGRKDETGSPEAAGPTEA